MEVQVEGLSREQLNKLNGVLFGGAIHSGDPIFHAPGARPWQNIAELRTPSVTYPLCGSALTEYTNNLSEMCPTKVLPVSVPSIVHSLTGVAYSPMAFTCCHDLGSNLLPPVKRKSD